MKNVPSIKVKKAKFGTCKIDVPAHCEGSIELYWHFDNHGPGDVDCLAMGPKEMTGVVLFAGRETCFECTQPVFLRSLDEQGATVTMSFTEIVTQGPPKPPHSRDDLV